MEITLLTGTANPPLAQAVARRLAVCVGDSVVHRFADSEQHVQIRESVRGRDVYLIQPTSSPVDEHLMEVLLLADACRRAGAARLTAVVPYFGYARHDRRASGREPVAARLVADLFKTAGVQRVVAVDLHSAALEGFFAIPIEHLSAVPLLADAARPFLTALPVRRFIATDSVEATAGRAIPLERVRLDALLAEAIRLLNEDRSLAALLAQG